MTGKPVRPRQRARQDIRDAVSYYRREASEAVAIGFVEAVQAAMRAAGEHPAAGPPRYAGLLDVVGLRIWPVERYPDLLFYLDREDHVDLMRVLHGRRDVASLMNGRT